MSHGDVLLADIDSLLSGPIEGEPASALRRIEYTLTDGFARLLRLEAERRRLQRELDEAVARLDEDAESRVREIATLGRRLERTDHDASTLRATLASLRARHREIRLAAPRRSRS